MLSCELQSPRPWSHGSEYPGKFTRQQVRREAFHSHPVGARRSKQVAGILGAKNFKVTPPESPELEGESET